ncbi:MAG: hypothetical protein HFH73_14120 [Lachnospiraceae bacterium]|nr:hypothetical protein [Lachnospiraceae bacterium]
MLYQNIVYSLEIFFIVLEIIVLLYLIQKMFDFGLQVRRITLILVAPILQPMQKIVKHSIMNTFSIDLSPYLLIVILSYLERLCRYLLQLSTG